MAIKRGSKVDASFSPASMTDLIFLLLIFLLISTTLINPNSNALRLQLPTSANQVDEKPYIAVSIQDTGGQYRFYIGTDYVPFSDLAATLHAKLTGKEDPTISLFCDKSVPIDEVVKVMNIAKDNRYKLILATNPH